MQTTKNYVYWLSRL